MMFTKKLFVPLFSILSFFFATNLVLAAQSSYLRLEASSTGIIEGDVTSPGREGTIEVLSYGHNLRLESATRANTVYHSPIRILKYFDSSSPLLYQAMINNEVLTEWVLEFWNVDQSGALELTATITLNNARITGIAMEKPNVLNADNLAYGDMQTITFAYQSITWETGNNSVTASVDTAL